MRPVSPEVSGRAFLGLIKHVKETYGATSVAELLPSLPASTQQVFKGRILHATWYPYDAYVGLLKGLAQKYGGGSAEFCRELGAASGTRDINTVFRIYLAIASTERLIRGCTKVWASYYRNAGTMEALRWEPEDTLLRITDFPQMAPEHCRLMEGWMITTMNLLGADVIDGHESACAAKGAPAHEFKCRWKKR